MKKNILIVDDFENTLFVTGFTIEQAGYTIFKAESGAKAMGILKKNPHIDLVITDYNMPQMNGLQLVEEIKTLFPNKFIPIFVLTTESKEEIRQNAMLAGVALWIRKPFKTEQLIEYIKRAIG
ncbi:MAG TPA: hypothetical protein DCQ31_00635 [Bacteroidales bacterium]|nr:hypothetical protein [Bacteroidales bacterium]